MSADFPFRGNTYEVRVTRRELCCCANLYSHPFTAHTAAISGVRGAYAFNRADASAMVIHEGGEDVTLVIVTGWRAQGQRNFAFFAAFCSSSVASVQ